MVDWYRDDMRTTVGILAGTLVACGAGPADEPVPGTPLAGQLNGVPWTAGSAHARDASDPGEKIVSIYPDVDLACGRLGDDPYVTAVLPWTAGVQPLGLDAEATVFIYLDMTAHVVFDGRIEILEAPTDVGATAPFRIRAVFEDEDDDLFVEGEIAVQLCE